MPSEYRADAENYNKLTNASNNPETSRRKTVQQIKPQTKNASDNSGLEGRERLNASASHSNLLPTNNAVPATAAAYQTASKNKWIEFRKGNT